jgi:hypothetical protein
MSIIYTYQIISVDESARCMEIVYRADGHQTLHIGARLPFEGETLEQVVQAFSPVALWEERARNVVVPVVGASGEITQATVSNLFVEQTTD